MKALSVFTIKNIYKLLQVFVQDFWLVLFAIAGLTLKEKKLSWFTK